MLNKIASDIIINHLCAFLQLPDLAIVMYTCRTLYDLQARILSSVKYITINRSTDIEKLTEHCPNIEKVIILSHIELHDFEYDLLFKLPITKLMIFNHDGTIAHPLVLPSSLITLHVNHLDLYDISECKSLEEIHYESYESNHIVSQKLSELPMLKTICGMYESEHNMHKLPFKEIIANSNLYDDDIRAISEMKVTHLAFLARQSHVVAILRNLKLKSLSLWNRFNNDMLEGLSIETLELVNTSITDHITLQSIQSLSLTNIIIDFSHLTTLSNLTSLQLEACTCSNANQLATLPIKTLTITNMTISVRYLMKLPLTLLELTTVTIEDNGLHDIPSTLTTLLLENINRDAINDISFRDNSKLNYLQIINYKYVRLTNQTLRIISSLPITELALSRCGITDDNIHHLARMQLNYLDLQTNKITSVGLRQLKHLPLRKLLCDSISIHNLL